MAATTGKGKAESAPIVLKPDPPVHILVQTLTHLVPGHDYWDKINRMLNYICQLHWNCDYDRKEHRWWGYNCRFALNNKRCFFLLDWGEPPNDDNVPIISYEWTGECLVAKPGLAQEPKIRDNIKKHFPFTDEKQSWEREPWSNREIAKHILESGEGDLCAELLAMRDSPEDLQWLKTHLRPRHWRKFVSDANTYLPTPDTPYIEE